MRQEQKAKAFSTRTAHAGGRFPALAGDPIAPPLTLASVYTYDDLDRFSEATGQRIDAWFYRRYGHANSRMLERAVSDLEGGEEALACSSGMAATVALFSTLAGRGDHVVAVRDIYGGTYSFLQKQLVKLGVGVDFVPCETERLRQKIQSNTRIIFLETVTNPLMRVPDFSAVVALARRAKCLVVVDNTFATPGLCRPMEFGVDAVYHSGTKFLNGHGDAASGIVVAGKEIIRRARRFAIGVGGTISPMDAWLTLRGLKTLSLRIERASQNALRVARWLSRQRAVERVHYPGLPSSPSHKLAEKYLRGGFGPMLSFELTGGLKAAGKFVRGCRMLKLAASLGDVTTTLSHPARSSHMYLSPEERRSMGITDGLIRLSTGIENVDDIVEDMEYGLRRV